MKVSKSHTTILLVLLTAISCLDPFSFEREDMDPAIVIDGFLRNNDGPHILTISNALAFGDKFIDPIPGARVVLNSPEGTFEYEEESPGTHVLKKGVLTGKPGEQYSVRIELPDGVVIQSTPEVMPQPLEMTRARSKFVRLQVLTRTGLPRRENAVEISIDANFPDPSREIPYYIRYGIEEDFSYPEQACGGLHQPKTCYVNTAAFTNDFTLLTSDVLSRGQVDSLVVLQKGDLNPSHYRGKHYFTVYQLSITPAAFQYWERIREVINQDGTVFDRPPARVLGNLYNESNDQIPVLGYFEVASVDIERTAFLPSEFFEFTGITEECSFFSRNRWPPTCCQCLGLPNATTIRPPWF